MKCLLKSKLLILCAIALLSAGCSEVPISGRTQFNFVPGSTMNSLSFKSYGEFLAQNKLSTNAEQTIIAPKTGMRTGWRATSGNSAWSMTPTSMPGPCPAERLSSIRGSCQLLRMRPAWLW